MNIFYLDDNIKECAKAHCDKHVIKMILESAQILCIVLHLTGKDAPYRVTHANHPCTIWARQSLDNWLWIKELVRELNTEYMYRYDKTTPHKSALIVEELAIPDLPRLGLTKRPCCMPEEYKKFGVINSYRNYYKLAKSELLVYTKRNQPGWLTIS